MAQIIDLPVITRLDLDPDRVLQKAVGKLKSAIVIGYDKNDGFFFASTHADAGNVFWLLEKAKFELAKTAGLIRDEPDDGA